MEWFTPNFFSGLFAIILLDLALAGDNAIVIAMAARNLPAKLQKKAVFWGTFGAIAVRIVLTAIVVYLLRLPGLMLVGGLLLLPIAWNLLKQDDDDPDVHAINHFWPALRTIVVADALMGMDNVLAIAGASKGHLGLVVIGLLFSVPLVVWGSTMIIRLIERFPIVIYIGVGAVALTASRMIANDKLVAGWFEAHQPVAYLMDVVLVLGICAGGWLMNRRTRQRRHDA